MSDVVTRDALYLYCICNEEGGVNRLSTQASCGGDADTDPPISQHVPDQSVLVENPFRKQVKLTLQCEESIKLTPFNQTI